MVKEQSCNRQHTHTFVYMRTLRRILTYLIQLSCLVSGPPNLDVDYYFVCSRLVCFPWLLRLDICFCSCALIFVIVSSLHCHCLFSWIANLDLERDRNTIICLIQFYSLIYQLIYFDLITWLIA